MITNIAISKNEAFGETDYEFALSHLCMVDRNMMTVEKKNFCIYEGVDN